MTAEIDGTTIAVIGADLTAMKVDAIVNAANEHLSHGGGLAAAIARAGGPAIQRESDAWVEENGPLSPGTAAVTTAGEMPARFVIHVAGPRHRPDQDNDGLLRTAVRAALSTAAGLDCSSVALPAISAGVFAYPMGEATAVIADEAVRWAADHDLPAEISLVGFDEEATAAFTEGLTATTP